jgi:hypothetical protein
MPATLVAREKRLAMTPLLVVSGTDINDRPFTDRTHAVDVSGSGLSFETPHNVTVGTRLTVRIHIPPPLRCHFHDQPVYGVRGMVARVARVPHPPHYCVGVKLLAELKGAA